MQWYYKEGDQVFGPLAKEGLEHLMRVKKVTARTLVRAGQTGQWRPLAEYASKKPTAPPPQEAPPSASQPPAHPADSPPAAPRTEPPSSTVCSQCGGSFPEDRIIRFGDKAICAACKPVFVQRLREGATGSSAMRYGGFWIRFGAKIIDAIALAIVTWALTLPLSVAMVSEEGAGSLAFVIVQQLIGVAVPVAYTTFFLGRFAATPGKMVCGLRVVTADGGRVSYGRALGRSFAEWLSTMILLIGYIMAAFDDEKRTLHDRICSTRVVRK